ncbi:tRNA (guanosine(37)-N1)-methyltransferase TrmD [Bdellovibrionota bacterium FG-1]
MAHPLSFEKEQSSKSSNNPQTSVSGRPLLEFHFLTLFPEVFPTVLDFSLMGKAQKKGLVSFQTTQIRSFATDKHHTVDDTPYGGGEGMLLKVDVLHAAWKSVLPPVGASQKVATILLSPQGQLFDQEMAKELATYSQLILVCGHYEGVDERFIDLCVDREVSVGNYVLTGGELPALIMAEAITRLLPGVVGNQRSITQDSLEGGLVKYPQYTRPRDYEGLAVPDILMTGDHGAITEWRRRQMEQRTAQKRPDLLVEK